MQRREFPDGLPVPLLVVVESGVFVIGAVGWNGRVDVVGGALHLNGAARTGEIGRLVEAARRISELLDSWTGAEWTVPVYAVMCLAGEAQVGGWVGVGGAHAVDAAWLTDFMESFEPQLGPLHVDWADTALGSRLRVSPRDAADRGPADDPAPQVERRTPRPPEEPVVFLRRVTDAEGDRFHVLDEEGTHGGIIDLRTRSIVDARPAAEGVLHQLLPHFVPDASADPPVPGWKRILPAGRHRGHGIVACMQWRGDEGERLYGFRLDDGGECVDLGWIDPSTGRVIEVETGAAEALRYCALQLAWLDQPR
ncbi:MAG: hypothetical protein IT195_10490 [Microthrixaceae bacterium]|nr:hypothetical protein [Microthrixaceae bacterium]